MEVLEVVVLEVVVVEEEVVDEDETEEDEENGDVSCVSDEYFEDDAVKLGDTEYVDGEVGRVEEVDDNDDEECENWDELWKEGELYDETGKELDEKKPDDADNAEEIELSPPVSVDNGLEDVGEKVVVIVEDDSVEECWNEDGSDGL